MNPNGDRNLACKSAFVAQHSPREHGLGSYLLNNTAMPPMCIQTNLALADLWIICWMSVFTDEIFPTAFVSWLTNCRELMAPHLRVVCLFVSFFFAGRAISRLIFHKSPKVGGWKYHLWLVWVTWILDDWDNLQASFIDTALSRLVTRFLYYRIIMWLTNFPGSFLFIIHHSQWIWV